jgi:hypothetical protein
MKRGRLRVEEHSEVPEIKRNIPALLREIVIKRDGAYIPRNSIIELLARSERFELPTLRFEV